MAVVDSKDNLQRLQYWFTTSGTELNLATSIQKKVWNKQSIKQANYTQEISWTLVVVKYIAVLLNKLWYIRKRNSREFQQVMNPIRTTRSLIHTIWHNKQVKHDKHNTCWEYINQQEDPY